MADSIEPVTHLEKTIAGEVEPVTHLEHVIALYGGSGGSGGSGTNNYNALLNKPSINGVTLTGNKTLKQLGITNYDDTQVKSDIADLDTNKQDKTDNALDTTDKTVVGAINEINGSTLDNITFSADYKNIVINRKSGLNPYTIPIASIIHNAKITELNDVDTTNIGDGKTLIYDGATQKHKYVSSTGTDELVKMEASTSAKYLSDLIDKQTVVNDNGVLKVKKLDGQDVTITEINHLKGLTMNVMDLVNIFANGGVKVLNTPVNTHADLLKLDRNTFLDGISYIVYVLADETHSGVKTAYLCDKTSETYFGNADSQRNFITNPIDLANEVTGKLGTSNIDVDALWKLLTINDTYKTLTANDEVFGTHGAKALYDELVADIGKKANATDLTTHTNDTNIHVTTYDKTKWNAKADQTEVDDIKTTIGTETLDSGFTATTLKGALNEVFQSASNGKELIANAITGKGVVTDKADTFQTMANNINSISSGTGSSGYFVKGVNSVRDGVWKSVSTLPYEFSNGSIVEYNNEIHILGGSGSGSNTKHYKWNGTEWTEVSSLPFGFKSGSAIVFNNEIHILGGTSIPTAHYKYNGTSWESVSTLPFNFRESAVVVYNNKIHVIGSYYTYTTHYAWDGTSWESVSTLPYKFFYGCGVIYNNEIHILGGNYSKRNHYKYNGTSWEKVSKLPYDFSSSTGKQAVVYNNKIHILGSNDSNTHYAWDGTSWEKLTDMPYINVYGCTIVYNDKIHVLGGGSTATKASHYALGKEKIFTFMAMSGTKIYTNGTLSADSFTNDDTNIYTITKDYCNVSIVDATYITVVKDETPIYVSNINNNSYLLSGMKLNGTTIADDGLYNNENKIFIIE